MGFKSGEGFFRLTRTEMGYRDLRRRFLVDVMKCGKNVSNKILKHNGKSFDLKIAAVHSQLWQVSNWIQNRDATRHSDQAPGDADSDFEVHVHIQCSTNSIHANHFSAACDDWWKFETAFIAFLGTHILNKLFINRLGSFWVNSMADYDLELPRAHNSFATKRELMWFKSVIFNVYMFTGLVVSGYGFIYS